MQLLLNLLACDVSTCNKSDNCSVYASEETPGWKAGASVAYCITCYKKEKHSCDTLRKESIVDRTAAGGKTQPVPEKQVKPKTSAKKKPKPNGGRSCLSLSERVEIIKFAEQNPSWGYRKLADKFGVGKTQIQKVLKSKEEITTAFESNISSGDRKCQ